MNRNERTRKLVTDLLYPAFLGNMTYVAGEEFFKHSPVMSGYIGIALVLALLAHFVFDWLYTSVESSRHNYTIPKVLIDLLIIVCLYVSLRLVLQQGGIRAEQWPIVLLQPVTWLLFAKVLAFLWELVEYACTPRQERTPLDRWEITLDFVFAILYLIYLAIISALGYPEAPLAKVILIGIILLDIGAYVWQIKEYDETAKRGQPA